MHRNAGFTHKLLCTAALGGVMLAALVMPSRSEGPMVPAPKLPPPPSAVVTQDAIYYANGSVYYPGTSIYVWKDGDAFHIAYYEWKDK
jgi:hypothetical protein